jgi:hypothetical protein
MNSRDTDDTAKTTVYDGTPEQMMVIHPDAAKGIPLYALDRTLRRLRGVLTMLANDAYESEDGQGFRFSHEIVCDVLCNLEGLADTAIKLLEFGIDPITSPTEEQRLRALDSELTEVSDALSDEPDDPQSAIEQ